jgi:hypothetical protein
MDRKSWRLFVFHYYQPATPIDQDVWRVPQKGKKRQTLIPYGRIGDLRTRLGGGFEAKARRADPGSKTAWRASLCARSLPHRWLQPPRVIWVQLIDRTR